MTELYLANERYDGYFRDRCVFRPEIDIEDTMNVVVKYSTDATMSYSRNAFNAWEGYAVSFNGAKGRLEHQIVEQVYTTQSGIEDGGVTIRIVPLRGAAQIIEPWLGEGGHGGGDPRLLDDMFLPNPPADQYMRSADQRAGAFSSLTGIAANESIRTGKVINIADLVDNPGMPDYPAMPSHTDALPMPTKAPPSR